MSRGVEALKRAEREAAARLTAALEADPYDPARYKKALLEWQSARIALRSQGIRVPDAKQLTRADRPKVT
jgi:hypothetical protein